MKAKFANLTRVLSLVFSIISVTRLGYCQSAPTNGLVGYYTFDSNPNDTTGISQNGVLNGAAISYTIDRFGASNAAVHFGGGGYISITPTPVDVNADYSITFWARLDNANSTPYNFLSTAEDNDGGMNVRSYANAWGWAFITEGDNVPINPVPTSFTSWHSLVCVHQDTNDLFYMDGLLITSGGHTTPTTDDGSLWLGRHHNPGNFNYDLMGAMDDVRLYSRALSVDEVSQLYNYEAPPPPVPAPKALVAYYQFNGNANDSTTNLHNGIINGTGITYARDRFSSNNSAVHFAGGGYISITPTPINVNSDYTVGCWVKLDNSLTMPYNIISTAQDNLGGMNVRTYANVFGWSFIAQGNDTPTTSVPSNFTTWHSLICVHQGTNDLFYIDGILRTSGGHTAPTTDDGSLWLGRHESSFYYDLHGILDDVRFYNYALTNVEVTQLYSNDISGFTEAALATGLITNGFFYGAIITDSGIGYTNTPVVRIIGGGGAGAVASAVVSNGMVVAINVSYPGNGYTNAPLVVIEPPVILNPALTISAMSLLTFSNLSIGTNYQLQLFQSNIWVNQSLSLVASNSVYSQYFSAIIDPSTYRLAIKPVPFTALATAQIAGGFFVGGTITSPGSGYAADAAITVTGGGGANGAAIAQVGGGVVTNIHILNPGSGYTSPPTLMIDPPPAGPVISPTAQPVMRIDSSGLAPYGSYQIEFAQSLGSGWLNYPGGLITPTDVTNSQYLLVTNSVGFFRFQYAP